MKKLFASVSYSFDNFYNNLNTQGQMVFSAIMFLIGVLCIILFVMYIINSIKTKQRINKIKEDTKKEIKVDGNKSEPLYTKETTEIEDIASAINDALKGEKPINLTNFEEDQERTAIISIDELMRKAKELEIVEDEQTGVNYLEKYNLEATEVEDVIKNTMKEEKPKEVKAFKVSQVISPIYGVRKDIVDNNK